MKTHCSNYKASPAPEVMEELPAVTIEPWMTVNLGLRQHLLAAFAFIHHYSPDGRTSEISVSALAAFTSVDSNRAEKFLLILNRKRLIEFTQGQKGVMCQTLVCNEKQAKDYITTGTGWKPGEAIRDNLHFPPKGLTLFGWMLTDKRLTPQTMLIYALLYQVNRKGYVSGTYEDMVRIFGIDKTGVQVGLKTLQRAGFIRLDLLTEEGFVCVTNDIGGCLSNSSLKMKVPEWIISSMGINQAAPLVFYAVLFHFRRGDRFSSTYFDFEKSFGFDRSKVSGYLTFLKVHCFLDVIKEDGSGFVCQPLAVDAITARFITKNRGKRTSERRQLLPGIRKTVFEKVKVTRKANPSKRSWMQQADCVLKSSPLLTSHELSMISKGNSNPSKAFTHRRP